MRVDRRCMGQTPGDHHFGETKRLRRALSRIVGGLSQPKKRLSLEPTHSRTKRNESIFGEHQSCDQTPTARKAPQSLNSQPISAPVRLGPQSNAKPRQNEACLFHHLTPGSLRTPRRTPRRSPRPRRWGRAATARRRATSLPAARNSQARRRGPAAKGKGQGGVEVPVLQ